MIAFTQLKQTVQQAIDGIPPSASTAVAGTTFFGWMFDVLPGVAALFSVMWLIMQMVMNWEKFVVQFKKIFKRKGKSENPPA